jgi:hypothetical protein
MRVYKPRAHKLVSQVNTWLYDHAREGCVPPEDFGDFTRLLIYRYRDVI